MKNLAHVASRFIDTPLMLHPPKLEVIIKALGSRLGIEGADAAIPVDIEAGAYKSESSGRDFEVVDGIAIIPVQGTLTKKETWMSAWSGCTSYAQVQRQIEVAIDDYSVQAIMLDIDSPGGETNGCFELSDYIYSARAKKPIYASANECALSAAYAIASAASKVFVTRTGCVGSIGVYALHVEQSEYDKEVGVKYTYVHAGAKKVDGNPHEPLSDAAESDIQAEVNREYGIFTSTVARNRKADEKKIVSTEAGLLWADNAIPLLADAVGTFDDAMNALREAVGVPTSSVAAEAAAISPKGEAPMEKPEAIAATTETQAAGEAPQVNAAPPCDKGKADTEPDPDDPEEAEEDEEEEQMEPEKKEALAAVPGASAADNVRSIEDIKAISALCRLAGKPDLAAEYLSQNKSVAEVSDLLTTARVEESEKTMIDSHVNPNKGGAARFADLEAEAVTFARQNKLTKEQAVAQLLTANPEVYATYRNQHNAKALLASLEAAGIQFSVNQ